MIMGYGNVYVAQIAIGANPSQALKAIREAEAYHGPSLIIGYAPCVNHGIKGGMGKTQNPFQLDSGEPKIPFKDFLMSEVRYMSLMQRDPELAEELFRQAQEDAHNRFEEYKRLSLSL